MALMLANKPISHAKKEIRTVLGGWGGETASLTRVVARSRGATGSPSLSHDALAVTKRFSCSGAYAPLPRGNGM